MDNFMENPWFIRIVALLLTLLLFVSANDLGNKKASGTTPNDMENFYSDVITEVPVQLIYDEENLVVSGSPKTVSVKIEGQRRFIEAVKRQRGFTVFIDLSNVEIGKHREPIMYEGISEKLKVTIDPGYADISLQEKVTEEFRVDAEFNRSIIAEGFEAERPEIEPKTVKITGAKDIVEKITYVKATIDASGLIKDTIRRESLVTVLDRDLNKLDVIVEPNFVSVTIPVKNPRKNVPLKIVRTGNPPEDIIIKTVSTNTPEVLIFGRTDLLQSISEIEVPVDVSNIHEDTELVIPIIYPEGLNKVTPEKITVNITTERVPQETTLKDIPLVNRGLAANLDIELINPADGLVSLKMIGDKDELKKAIDSGVHVFLQLDGLAIGEHEIEPVIEGPDILQYELSVEKVKVRLTEKGNV